ncbi:esterase/lipase family protein [Streptomyces sp. NPDC057889]|uniref:esterase/lipase family protein n=1 Tax=unclassified Streptomyces TaxID=2593676 RepID=UPI00369B658B
MAGRDATAPSWTARAGRTGVVTFQCRSQGSQLWFATMRYRGKEDPRTSLEAARPGTWPRHPHATSDISHDAVVVLPGIMGSALRDAESGRLLWGLSVRLLERAWRHRDGLLPLHLTPAEREGRYERVKATGLLEVPAWAPFLQGFEPYGNLLAAVGEVTADDAAVLAFPYDWRLPVAVNGSRLAAAARRHLTVWRAHPASRRDDRPARLVFVAHSMGGLVTRAALAQTPDLVADTRAVITLGTPFYGAVKAAVILNGDRHAPLTALPRHRMTALAAGMPGVHDLLPDFRCVDAGLDVLRLTPTDVAALGGDKELATQAMDFQQRVRTGGTVTLPGHRAVVGVAQPTMQSLRLADGVVHEQHVAFRTHPDGQLVRDADGVPERRDRAGDGTVYRESASLGGPVITYLPLQHGALAKDGGVLRHVRAVITEQDDQLGPPMGAGEIGLTVPEDILAGVPWTLRLTGADSYAGITCTVHEAETDRRVDTLRLGWSDDDIAAQVTLPAPGLYRVRVDTGGTSPLTQLVLASEPGHSDEKP